MRWRDGVVSVAGVRYLEASHAQAVIVVCGGAYRRAGGCAVVVVRRVASGLFIVGELCSGGGSLRLCVVVQCFAGHPLSVCNRLAHPLSVGGRLLLGCFRFEDLHQAVDGAAGGVAAWCGAGEGAAKVLACAYKRVGCGYCRLRDVLVPEEHSLAGASGGRFLYPNVVAAVVFPGRTKAESWFGVCCPGASVGGQRPIISLFLLTVWLVLLPLPHLFSLLVLTRTTAG